MRCSFSMETPENHNCTLSNFKNAASTSRRVRLTVCLVDWYLAPALRQHCGALDARSQHHGLGRSRHFLFLLAEDAGENLPLRRGGASVGPDGDAHLHLLHGAAGRRGREQNGQRGSKVKAWGFGLGLLYLSGAVTASP